MKVLTPEIHNRIRHGNTRRWQCYDFLVASGPADVKCVSGALNITERQAYTQLYELSRNRSLVTKANGLYHAV